MKIPAAILLTVLGLAFSANQTLVNLPADSWYTLPNSKMDAVCMPGLGGYSCWAIAGAWGGAAYDSDDRLMIVWGGGHGDSYDNSVYGFSLNTLAWSRIKDNTGVYVNGDPQSNGDPSSRHTYDGLAYIAHARRFFGYNGATAVSGGASTVVWTFDVAAKKWHNMNASGPKPGQNFGGNGGCAYDPVTKNVFYASTDAVYAYSYDSNAWTSWAVLNPQEWGKKRAVLDGKRRILFIFGAKLYAFDLATRQDVSSAWVTSGGSSIFSSGQAAADYDVVADQLVGWAGSSGVYVLNMSTKVWTQRSNAGAPTSSCGNGTYGRFRYIPEDNVFVLINANPAYADGYQNVWFYKNTPGGGTMAAEFLANGLSDPARLRANPNPFRARAAISFALERESEVSLEIFDLNGRMTAWLVNGRLAAGEHRVALNSARLSPGVYLARLSVNGRQATVRLMILK